MRRKAFTLVELLVVIAIIGILIALLLRLWGATLRYRLYWADDETAAESVRRGGEYLVGRVEDDTWTEAAPIGLYFASLWYAEDMYPVAWTVEALGRASEVNHSPV